MANDENAASDSNGQLVSRKARDMALFTAIGVFAGLGVLSYFQWPVYEAGAMMALTVTSNIISFLLGTKSALAAPSGTAPTT